MSALIPDVQGSADTRRLPINKVGIKDIRHPILVCDQHGNAQHTVALCNLFVNLPHHFKGTHMSRFVEILNVPGRAISLRTFREMLGEMTDRLEAQTGYIDLCFPYFIDKTAPVSGVCSMMDYAVTLSGQMSDGKPTITLKVIVPVTSLCPCSKEISQYGAHNQRSHVTVTVRVHDTAALWIEDIITLVEQEASCELYALLKRTDEKYVTERAYDNPKFVEDAVRDVAARLHQDDRIAAYCVESENFESIHNHSAYARIDHEKQPL